MSEGANRTGGSSRAEILAADLKRRRAELGDQHKELSGLIKQAAAELDRAGQRTREASGRLKQVESNPEGFSHSDVRRAYAAVQEAQMRQFMMQTQLEQLRNRQGGLDSTDDLLRQLISTAEELVEQHAANSEGPMDTGAAPASRPADRTAEGASAAFKSIELAQSRLSRQLQDETAQILSDLILRAEVCERLVDLDKQKARAEVASLKQAAASALKTTRQFIQEMRSPTLDESGLAMSLRRYAESLKATGRQQVDFQVVGTERNLPRATETAAFRIVQEALANAALHSGTKRAEVRLRYTPEEVAISVADEGKGFEVESTLQRVQEKETSGLLDLQMRAQLIGGTVELSSTPGSGCVVKLSIPA